MWSKWLHEIRQWVRSLPEDKLLLAAYLHAMCWSKSSYSFVSCIIILVCVGKVTAPVWTFPTSRLSLLTNLSATSHAVYWGRGECKRGTEAKCKNEIWQSSLFFSKIFLVKERNTEKKFFSFLYFSLKEKHKILSRLCPFSVECHSSLSIKGPKKCHQNQWSIAFEMGRVHFLCLLCGLEGLKLLTLWVNWGCFSTWFLLLF
jgi:hypothetical protein